MRNQSNPIATDEVAAPVVGFDALGLSESVMAAVRDLGYDEPTPVQREAIPRVLEGRDLLAAAQTGTGKTAAFLLPGMSRLGHHERHQGPLMLVVTPTRELAQQIEDVCSSVARHTHHDCLTVVGGVGYEPQKRGLARGCDVLVATPGRLVDLIDQGFCDLSNVRTLVLDEADRMLDMGFLPSMRKIVSRTPEDRQTLLFSATLDERAIGNIRDLVRDPATVEIAHKGTVAETIDQYVLPVSPEAKNKLLAQVLLQEGTDHVIVFCRTKHRADACCRRLRRAKVSCAPIHGNRSQNQRERALASFRSGKCDVLVATDVLARGIDVSDVRYVVNFDVPADPEDYIHRIGRTGRAGETGWSLTFVTGDDVEDLLSIERLMGKAVPEFGRTGSLELGEEPPSLDPDRDPTAGARGGRKGKSRKRRGRRRNARGADMGPDTESSAKVAALGTADGDAPSKGGRGRRRRGNRGAGSNGQPRRDAGERRGARRDDAGRSAAGGEGKPAKAARKGGGQAPKGRQGQAGRSGGAKPRRRVGDRLGTQGGRR